MYAKAISQLDWISDSIFIPDLNSFLICVNNKIYKKDLDGRPPYLYIQAGKFGNMHGKSFIYSKKSKKLVVIKDFKHFVILNPVKRKIELRLEGISKGSRAQIDNNIADFALFGRREQRLVSITDSGVLSFYNFGKASGRVVDRYRVGGVKDLIAAQKSIAVCSQNRYIFVMLVLVENQFLLQGYEIMSKKSSSSSRNSRALNLELQHRLYYCCQDFGCLADATFAFCRYYRGFATVILFGRSYGLLMVVGRDPDGGLKVIEAKKIPNYSKYPLKIEKLGNHFYYTGDEANLVRFQIY